MTAASGRSDHGRSLPVPRSARITAAGRTSRPTDPPLTRPLLLAALALFVAVTLVIAGLVTLPSSAAAAELGPGYRSPSHPLDHLGAYIAADGTMTYCIDVGMPSTVGAVTTDAGTLEQVNDLGADEMLRLSFVLAEHGTTTDPRTAAAVAMVVWGIAGAEAYRSIGGDAKVLRRAPESERGAIQALADRFRAEAAAFAPTAPAASMTLSIDEGDEYAGFLDISVQPDSARGTVTLANAVFADSGLASRSDVADGAHLAIVGDPRGAPGVPYRVSAAAEDFSAPGEPSGTIRLFSTPGAQSLVAAGASTPTVFGARVSDARDRAVPTLTTIAQAAGLVGGTIRDSAIVEGIPSSGVELIWSAYLQPAASSTPVCTGGAVAFETDVPLTVTADGTYPSPDFVITDAHVGTIYWVATLLRDGAVIAQGRCGDPAETTVVSSSPPRLPVVSG